MVATFIMDGGYGGGRPMMTGDVCGATARVPPPRFVRTACLAALIVLVLGKPFPGQASEATPQSGVGAVPAPSSVSVFNNKSLSITATRSEQHYLLQLRSISGAVSEIELPLSPRIITGAREVASGKIVVDLPINQYGSEQMLVIDGSSGELVDRIVGIHPAFSPNGNFVVFIAPRPAHAKSVEDGTEFTLLYDLRKSAGANRAWPRTDFDTFMSPERKIGTQIYPLSRQVVPAAGVPGVRPTHSVTSPFYWSPDSRMLAFADEQYPAARLAGSKTASGNVLLSPRIPPRAGISLVLIKVDGYAPHTFVLPLPICATVSGPACGNSIDSASFDATGIRYSWAGMQGEKSQHADFSEFISENRRN